MSEFRGFTSGSCNFVERVFYLAVALCVFYGIGL